MTGAVSADGPTPQLVIFDLDGTLTDSAEGIVTSFLHALSHIGAPVPEGDLAAQIVGPPMDETFRTMGLGEVPTRRSRRSGPSTAPGAGR